MNLHKISFILLIIGGLNWGLALFGADVGTFLPEGVTKIVYVLVALAAISEVFGHKKTCKMCDSRGGSMGSM